MWKIQQLSELYIDQPGAPGTCGDSNGTKASGLKSSPPLPGMESSPLPFSVPLSLFFQLLFPSSPISSFAPSSAWWPCVPFLTTIFLLELRIGGSVTNPNPSFSPLSSHLVLLCIFTPTVDSKGSLTGNVANYSLLKEDTWGILRCFIITSDLITPLQSLRSDDWFACPRAPMHEHTLPLSEGVQWPASWHFSHKS